LKTAEAKRALLVIDDDRVLCKAISRYFSGDALEVASAHTGAEGLHICSNQRVDVVLLDQKLPDVRGADLCPSLVTNNDKCKIIFITAYPSFDNAVEAIKAGAHDYLSKPFEMGELELAVDRAFRTLSLERTEQIQQYKNSKESEETALIGKHGGLGGVQKLVELAASSDAPVLITGETGAGKSIVAKSVHFRGHGKGAPFISINCGALPENLIEAELFGFERGAFTGAHAAKRGIFEMAEGGTLFLDEIGALPLHLQSKLLGVLDDKKIRRLGGETMRPVDVRILAATNLEIEQAVSEKAFRDDLYYRLSVMRIRVPPLRERPLDIPDLCRFFVRNIAGNPPPKLPDEEVGRLKAYSWPGNVRELRNIIERSIILRKGDTLRPSQLLGDQKMSILSPLDSPAQSQTTESTLFLDEERLVSMEEMEMKLIRRTLATLSGNRTRAAQSLGISRATLLRKIRAYGLGLPASK
jgi:DNA-binding NtrC family response regulator